MSVLGRTDGQLVHGRVHHRVQLHLHHHTLQVRTVTRKLGTFGTTGVLNNHFKRQKIQEKQFSIADLPRSLNLQTIFVRTLQNTASCCITVAESPELYLRGNYKLNVSSFLIGPSLGGSHKCRHPLSVNSQLLSHESRNCLQ